MTATATVQDALPGGRKPPEDQQQPASLANREPQQTLASAERAHFDNVFRWGKAMAASGFFKDAREAAQAMVKIQAGHELGIPPAAAMRGVYVFDGKISLAAALMTGKVNESPHYEFDLKETTDKKCLIEWHGRSKRTGQWRTLGTSSFTIEEAKVAGLLGKDNWQKYPKAMLLARAMSAGCRTYCPELFNGAVYVPEEVGETVTIDGDGNVTHYEPAAPPANGTKAPTNVTPEPVTGERSRNDLLAAARAANGITGSSMTAEQMKTVLGAIGGTLGKQFTSLRDVTDDDLRAYVEGRTATSVRPEEEVLYCPACGAQTSPKASAEPHAEGCPEAPISEPGERV